MKFSAVLMATIVMLFLGALAPVAQAEPITGETLNLAPATDNFDWTGTGSGYTNSVDMLEYPPNASGSPFTDYDECGSQTFHSCALFDGKAPFVYADSSGDFTNSHYGWWVYTVPGGPDSYIDKASSQVANVTGESIFDLPSGPPIAITAIWDGSTISAGEATQETEELKMIDGEGGPGVRQAFAGLLSGFTESVPYDHWAGWQKLDVDLSDEDIPTADLDENSIPDGWLDENSTFQVGLDAEDTGLGLRYAMVLGSQRDVSDPWEPAENQAQGFGWIDHCVGNTEDPCPAETPNGFAPTVEVADLPEGHTGIDKAVGDGAGHFAAEWVADISVDTMKPEISLDGSFMSAPGMVLTAPSYTLEADATDGESGKENSGVVDLKVLVDDVVIDSDSQSCPTENCALDLDPTIDSDDYSNGPHQLKVKATDAVGHIKTTTVDFEVDR
ncbi:MAG: hypothetical protein J0H98_09395 [Solirubrobacterales bacterium]|nr:hypothetical protein [Solirubrobacterales bacterium]